MPTVNTILGAAALVAWPGAGLGPAHRGEWQNANQGQVKELLEWTKHYPWARP